jgi:glycosyltransferase involved in cell wall biosynthesis
MADRQLGAPRVSINIPCYRQLPWLRRCLASILAQTLQDFEVTLLDDGASDEYAEYVQSLGDPRVRYVRNPVRLGAMQNMFAAITVGRGAYTMAFHEDDVLGRHYLETACALLDGDPSCGFVGAEMHGFTGEPDAARLARPIDPSTIERYANGADFVRALFRGVNPMFGSIVYRRAALDGVAPAHEEYATLVDRPFLLAILERWSCAIVRDAAVFYQEHGEGDVRHQALAPEHILRLLGRYRAALPPALTGEDRRLFYDFSGYWLFTLYRMAAPSAHSSLRRFVVRAWRDGLYDPRWSRGYARKQLLALMLTGH